MRRTFALLAVGAFSFLLSPQSAANGQMNCTHSYYTHTHPSSGVEMCMHYMTCSDGYRHNLITDGSYC